MSAQRGELMMNWKYPQSHKNTHFCVISKVRGLTHVVSLLM